MGPALAGTDVEAPTLDARARTPRGRARGAWGTRWRAEPRGRIDRAWPDVEEAVSVQLLMTLELVGPGLSSPPTLKKELRRPGHALRQAGPQLRWGNLRRASPGRCVHAPRRKDERPIDDRSLDDVDRRGPGLSSPPRCGAERVPSMKASPLSSA